MSAPRTFPVIKQIGIIGFGQMGQGIAQVAAMNGFNVKVYDSSDNALRRGEENIIANIRKYASRHKDTLNNDPELVLGKAMNRVQLACKFDETIENSNLIIEAAKEDRDVKSKIFHDIFLSKKLMDDAIVATNTSSYQVSEFSALSPIVAPRVVGLHFFNPVDRMNLVEIIKTEKTVPQVVESLHSFVKALGKVPVECKDTPGFIVNRLLVPYLYESIRLVEEDVASIEDIDTAMKLGAGYPMGPFELLDYIGLDTAKAVMDGWRATDPTNPKFAPSYILDRLVAQGNLGKKSGAGFYDYQKSNL